MRNKRTDEVASIWTGKFRVIDPLSRLCPRDNGWRVVTDGSRAAADGGRVSRGLLHGPAASAAIRGVEGGGEGGGGG